MSRVAFPLVLQSPSSGSAIVGATATITQHVIGAGTLGTGPAASIYTQEVGGTPLASNQIVTDNLGRWTQGSSASYAPYYLPPGCYDIAVSGTGLTGFVRIVDLTSAADSGWVNLTVTIGTATGPDPPQARKIGNRVYCRGAVTAASGGFEVSFPDLTWAPTTINMWLPVPSTLTSERATNATVETISSVLYLAQTSAGFYTSGASYDLTACGWFLD